MKYKVMGFTGVFLIVLGVALIILQLTSGEKSLMGSIATGASPITTGSVLIGVSQMLQRKKKALIEQSKSHN